MPTLVWPYARRTTYVNGSLPAISADDLNAMQDETASLAYQYLLETYGDGSDGACVFDGTTAVPGTTLVSGLYTLTRNIQATTISVVSTARIAMKGYELQAQQSITLNACSLFAAGVVGGAPLGGFSATGPHSCRGLDAQMAIFSTPPAQLTVCGLGGDGGNGGTSGVNPYAPGIVSQINFNDYKIPPFRYGYIGQAGYITPGPAIDIIRGGGGGGPGQGDGSNAGGGGGEAGQLMVLRAPIITLANGPSFNATGGPGGNSAGGNACGGGGGGGGAAHFIYEQLVITGAAPTYTMSGGAAGTGTGTGGNGHAGLNGPTTPFLTKLAA